MKYILIGVLAVLLSISQVSAGILEYNMGQKVKTNASKEESVDAVESIQVVAPSKNKKIYQDSNTIRYDYGNYYRYYRDESLSSYRYPFKNTKRKKYTEYYYDVLNSLENDLNNIQKEQEYVEDVISDISKELKRYSRYNAYDRKELRDEQKYMKDRKKDLEEQEKGIKKEIKEVKKNKKHYKKYNRYNDRYYNYPSYKYSNYYDEYYYYHRQNFVNPDLKDVKEGRIYIR